MSIIEDLKTDQDFIRMSPEAKQIVLSQKDPDFARLSPAAQSSVISTAFPGMISQDHPIARVASKVYTPLIETAAMMTGGAAGTPLGIGGSVAGGAAMYPLGKQAAEGLDTYLGLPSRQPPATVGESLTRTAKDIETGAALEAGGQAVNTIAAPIARGFGAPLAETYGNDIQVLANKFKIPLTAAARMGTVGLARLESALSKVPIASGLIKRANDSVRQAIEENVVKRLISQGASPEEADAVGTRILDKIMEHKMRAESAPAIERGTILSGTGPELGAEQAGTKIQKALVAASQKHASEVVDPLYAKAQQAAGTSQADAPALAKKAQDLLSEIGNAKTFEPGLVSKLKVLAGTPEGAPGEPVNFGGVMLGPEHPMYERIMREFSPNAPTSPAYSYPALKHEVESLKALAAKESEVAGTPGAGARYKSTPAGRIYNKLAEAGEADLNSFGGNPDVSKYRAQGTAAAREGHQKFGSDYVGKLLTSKPEEVLDHAIEAGDVTNVRNLMGILGPQEKQIIQDHFLKERLLAFPEGRFFDRTDLAKNLAKYKDTLPEILPQDKLAQLRSLAASRSDLPIDHPFFRRFVQDSARSNPSRVIAFLTSKGTTPEMVDKIRGTVGEDLFSDLQDQVILRLGLDKTPITQTKGGMGFALHGVGAVAPTETRSSLALQFNPKRFAENVERIGFPTYRTLFSGAKQDLADSLYLISNAASTTERLAGNPSGTAQAYGAYRLMIEGMHNPPRASKDVLASVAGTLAYLGYAPMAGRIVSFFGRHAPELAGVGARAIGASLAQNQEGIRAAWQKHKNKQLQGASR